MPKTMIFEGKTTSEAIEKGLKEFNTSRENVDIKVLEEEKRSFFSILAPRVVKVEMTLKENRKKDIRKREREQISEEEQKNAMKIVEDFVKEFTQNLKQSEIEYKLNIVGEYIEVELNGQNAGYLIGYRGETLNSIQVIMNAVLKNRMKTHLKVTVDICGYKKERVKTLEQLAERVANSVMKTGKTVTLDPMRPYERKIIHSKLQENSEIRTHSVGEEPYRKIVISLNK